MKAVADTLGVARSNLAERARTRPGPRQPCRKAGDAEFLPVLRRLVDERPTYGYRRLTALLNRERQVGGGPPVNRKRVLRILRADGLTLQAHTARRPGRAHDGVVVALRSDVRWCSDHFELGCRDGSTVRVPFAIDACDREVIAWQATTGGVSGEMVRDLMVECVERRFGATRAAHPVGWLSDDGSGYRAKDTLDTATRPGAQARLHATPLAREQRPRRGPGEDPQAGLRQGHRPARRRDRAGPRAGLGRRPRRRPPALRAADALAPGVPRPLCLTQPATCPVRRGALQPDTSYQAHAGQAPPGTRAENLSRLDPSQRPVIAKVVD